MMDFIKRPLYVYDLPYQLLDSLQKRESQIDHESKVANENQTSSQDGLSPNDPSQEANGQIRNPTSCNLCQQNFEDHSIQRIHRRSDWHSYNLRQRSRHKPTVSENEFDNLIDDLNESLSGSDSDESSEDDDAQATSSTPLETLLRRQALHDQQNPQTEHETFAPLAKRKRGSGRPPLEWFSSPLLPSNTFLGVYRALYTQDEQRRSDFVASLKTKQLPPAAPRRPIDDGTAHGVPLPSTMTSPSIFMCMLGGGHFAGMIVSLAPKKGHDNLGSEQRQAIVIAHKTFHRYTTRQKQGGAQSANDNAKGNAHSAGSTLRRYNEIALEQDIRNLLAEWKALIDESQLVFARATGSSNRRILFGPYDGQILHVNDPRNRSFPFSTRRATQAELMRAFVELTRVKVEKVDEAAVAAENAAAFAAKAKEQASKISANNHQAVAQASKPSQEELELLQHTSQIRTLVNRSKAPALILYLQNNHLSPSFTFHRPQAPENHHAPTPLHLAAALNSAVCVTALLLKANADPCVKTSEGKTPFELAGERVTRDAFRVARNELGEEKWPWSEGARVPLPIPRDEAEARAKRDRTEREEKEQQRRKDEEDRLRQESAAAEEAKRSKPIPKTGKSLASTLAAKTAEEKREEDGRGMTPEMRRKMERERRARAAEARFSKSGNAGSTRLP